MQQDDDSGRKLLARLLGIAILVGIAIVLLLPALKPGTDGPGWRVHCTSRLHGVGLALTNYSRAHGSFPPAVIRNENGVAIHGWRELLINNLEGQQTGDWHPAQPWHSADNRKAAEFLQTYFHCPSDLEQPEQETSYIGVTHAGFIFAGDKAVKLQDITDGLENTIIVVEASSTGVLTAAPHDLSWEEFVARYKEKDLSVHEGGFNALFADGHVEFLNYKLDERVLQALLTIAGGEDLKAMGYER